MTECNPNAVTNDCTGEYVQRDERKGCESRGVGYHTFLAIACFIFYLLKVLKCRSQWPRGQKAWVCGGLLVGIAGSNPAGGMDVCLF